MTGVAGGRQRHSGQRPPVQGAAGDLERKVDRLVRVVADVRHAVIEAGKEKRVGIRPGFHRVVHPRAAPPKRRAKLVELVRVDEPEVRVGLLDHRPLRANGAVRKLVLGRVVAAADHRPLPLAKVAGDLQVRRERTNASGVLVGELLGEVPKHAVHRHQQAVLGDRPNAGPLGVPAVGTVVGVGWPSASGTNATCPRPAASRSPTDSPTRSSTAAPRGRGCR